MLLILVHRIDFLYPDPQNYADPRIRIQGAKYQSKTGKKKYFLPKSELLKKERLLKFPDFLKIHQVLA